MKFNIIINASQNWQQSCQHALVMSQTIIDEGHEIGVVFFYGQSVKIIHSNEAAHDWMQWQKQHQVHLFLCSTMLEKENTKKITNLDSCFQVVGLATWTNALENADKTIEIS